MTFRVNRVNFEQGLTSNENLRTSGSVADHSNQFQTSKRVFFRRMLLEVIPKKEVRCSIALISKFKISLNLLILSLVLCLVLYQQSSSQLWLFNCISASFFNCISACLFNCISASLFNRISANSCTSPLMSRERHGQCLRLATIHLQKASTETIFCGVLNSTEAVLGS